MVEDWTTMEVSVLRESDPLYNQPKRTRRFMWLRIHQPPLLFKIKIWYFIVWTTAAQWPGVHGFDFVNKKTYLGYQVDTA